MPSYKIVGTYTATCVFRVDAADETEAREMFEALNGYDPTRTCGEIDRCDGSFDFEGPEPCDDPDDECNVDVTEPSRRALARLADMRRSIARHVSEWRKLS